MLCSVVLRGVNHPGHPAFLEGFDDFLRVEIRRVEERRAFVAVAPFAAGERVETEVRERVKFQPLPLNLRLGRRRAVRFRRAGAERGKRFLLLIFRRRSGEAFRGSAGERRSAGRERGEGDDFSQGDKHARYFCGGVFSKQEFF